MHTVQRDSDNVNIYLILNFSHFYAKESYYRAVGLSIRTNTRHSWPLSSEGSLTCHAYRDTGQPFIMVISEDP